MCEGILDVLLKICGGVKVISFDFESIYDVLFKYGVDFMVVAREGKLDLVIGCDSEICCVV